jgi:lipoprotein-releasing system permease protein
LLSFERFLTIRYLRRAQGSAEGAGFLRFVLYVAVGGVAIGVSSLLIALAIVRGFSHEIEVRITAIGAHVQVRSMRDEPLDDADRIHRVVESVEGVTSVTPVVQEFGLLRRSRMEIEGVLITGVPELPVYLRDRVTEGSVALASPSAGELPPVILGDALRETLGTRVGDRVTVFSMRLNQRGDPQRRPQVKQFVVAGIFETSLDRYDEILVYVGIDEARELLAYSPGDVSRFDVALTDVSTADSVASRLTDELGFPAVAESIYDVFSSLFAWVGLQQSIIPVVIGIIILVAAFNIIGTLLMIILEKTEEIGIMSSMGASAVQIRRLFVCVGLAIGVVGSAVGAGLAYVLAVVQLRYEVIKLPAESYYMSSAPILLNPFDFVVVIAIALALCVAMAWIPARVAARVDPVRVVRFR